ncbi:ATATH13, putative [Ricinus communis]|uniref:ATATH13, putative n=1 Tax=Ricinus communis TaxID=3988 RepID=B9SFD0_RICCO|nr:ATATH13, putative [Ricinus communis]
MKYKHTVKAHDTQAPANLLSAQLEAHLFPFKQDEFLMFGNIKKVGRLIILNQRHITKCGTLDKTVGLHLPLYRYYDGARYWFSSKGGYSSFGSYGVKEHFCRKSYVSSRNYTVFAASNVVTRHAQHAFKRLCRKGSVSHRSFPHISRIAQAVSLALTRSHLLVPGIFAISYGQVAWAERTFSEMDFYPLQNSLYMRAQDGHAYVTSLVLAIVECFILLVRALYLAILFSPSLIMAPFVDCCGPQFRKRWLQVVHRTLEKAEVPVASGSIAQVHRASLRFRYPGQKQVKPMVVAVKVRHPGVGESIRRDFEIINMVAKLSNFIPTLNWLRLDESVQQFAVFMMSQVDLAREAAHLSRFIYNFRRWKDVSFPKPVYPLVHPAVLVETYEQGESVSHFVDELEGHDRIKSALAHIGTHALLKMLLVDNFIHADMHPGNILVRMSQNKSSRKGIFKSKPHVVFLDVGMTAELSRSDRVNLLEFFKSVARRDGRTAAECALRLSKQQNCPNPKAFIEEVEEAFTFWGTPEGDLIHPAECMQELLEKVRRHKVNIDGNVCTVMVTTLVLEGWQRKLDPAYNVMQTLQTLLLRADWAKSLSYTIDGLMAP